jgi:peptidyl-prolyl cis-trans isomerase C
MKYVPHVLCLLAGAALGGFAAYRSPAPAPAAPDAWVARIGSEYLTPEMLQQEMRRRGGLQPGQFHDVAQKRALLDDMLLHRALVDAARADGLDRQPETRRSIEQLLTSQYLQDTLRKQQGEVKVDAREVAAFYAERAAEYTVPARRRVAMLRVAVMPGADEAVWAKAEARAAEALAKARALAPETPDFGLLAREYSEDVSSRYRGGVIGWLTEGRREGYRHDARMLEAAFALQQPGEFSAPVRGADGVYVARLVERQDAAPRRLEELEAGLRQRLLQERYAALERRFRDEVLAKAPIEVDEDALAAVAPLSPPARTEPPAPPAMPGNEEAAP